MSKYSNTLFFKYLILSCLVLFSISIKAQDIEEEVENTQGPMSNKKLNTLIEKLDPDFTGQPGYWNMQMFEMGVTIITDENADRMRIIVPVIPVQEISGEELFRLIQANFDSTLDARYAVARGVVWATYIHPLSPLSNEQFISGLGQTLNIVVTYGKTYTSGALTFGGGDSDELMEKEIIEELMRRGGII